MRRPLLRVLLLAAVLTAEARAESEHAPPKVRTAPEGLSGEEARAVELYRKVLPAVVTVFVTQQTVTPQGVQRQQGLGSGVLISPECHILTAAHVVEGADEIQVKTQDGVSRPARVVYSEPSADIALVRLTTPDRSLTHATLGDSDRLAVGQVTYVIGSPLGLEDSFSMGHISGFREFGRLYDGTILAEFIQTDAAINSGNSGGPMFDSRGEVIGISSRIMTKSGGSEGIGFVVAINTAKALLALEDRAWMGIEGVFLGKDELATLFNLDLDGGLLVQRVVKGSPADVAGLRAGSVPAHVGGKDILLGGDLIVQINEQHACHRECLVREGQRMAGQSRIPVRFLRGGREMRTVVDVAATRRNFLQ